MDEGANHPRRLLRPATMDDYGRLCELIRQSDRHHAELIPEVFQPFKGPARSREHFGGCVESPDADYLVVAQDGTLVAYLCIRKASYPAYPMFRQVEFALIEDLYVDPAYRRGGIAGMLLGAAREWARARGLGTIQLNVWAANTGAIALYQAEGFGSLSCRMETRLDLDER